MAIKQHKQEMERKVACLQQSLEARERELRDTQRELTDRNMKVKRIRGQNMSPNVTLTFGEKHTFLLKP